MKKKKQIKLNSLELKQMLIQNNIKVKPSYCHEDYLTSSFNMLYPIKAKLDKMSKKYGVSQSTLIQMLVDDLEE